MRAPSQTSGIFLKTDEMACLLSPLLFLPLIIWEFTQPEIPNNMRLLSLNIVETVLGSAGHNGLSWALLFLFPEGQRWLAAKGGKKEGLKIFGIAGLIFIGAALLFCLPLGRDNVALKTFFMIDWILVFHHSLHQSKGLLFAYNLQQHQDPSLRALVTSVHRSQKWAFHLLLAVSILPGFHYILGWNILDSTAEKLAIAAVACILISFIIVRNQQLPGNSIRQALFSCRLFYFPLGVFSFFAALAYRAVHSLEYIFIFRRMSDVSRSRQASPVRWLLPGSLLLFFATICIWTFSMNSGEGWHWVYGFNNELPLWFKLLAALSVTRLYMHYYLDRRLFRMRDGDTATHFGPLLVTPTGAQRGE